MTVFQKAKPYLPVLYPGFDWDLTPAAVTPKPRKKWSEYPKNPVKRDLSLVDIVTEPPEELFEPLNLTAPLGGFSLDENQLAEKARLDRVLAMKQADYDLHNPSPAGRRDRAGIDSLVQRCISPTRLRSEAINSARADQLAAMNARMRERGITPDQNPPLVIGQDSALCGDAPLVFGGVDHVTGEVTGANFTRPAVARLLFREWSDEYRFRVCVDASPTDAPPPQAGDRITTQLTERGARNVMESGAYLQAVKGGYTTFLTLTFDNDARGRLFRGETTIGAEVSRFFDALGKMYRRGWQCANEVLATRNGFDCVGANAVVPGHDKFKDSFDYCWVAEAPIKAKVVDSRNGFQCIDDLPNPHCHVLLRWQVEPYLFHDWANRIERLWGQGFAKLERIKHAKAASQYLLKALGYLTKGKDADQGEIQGNRYSMSKSARAPGWECLSSYHAQNMAAIIGELQEAMQRRFAPIRGQIAAHARQMDKAIRDVAVLKEQKQRDKAAKVKARIAKLESLIAAARQKLQSCPIRVADFQVTFKGEAMLDKFTAWATGARLWDAAELERVTFTQPNPMREAMGKMIAGYRRHYRHIAQLFEASAALWPQLLTEQWRTEPPEPAPATGAQFGDYERWISTT
ncbi:hypothetical protein L2750_12860 [Shewanella submarina]|uniref:Replication protein n=1 Tax=Shewanella submarina TaxID=2016376 RepID=A0ABV7GHE4_9GAMM|nr:hypothetical protein [Shewanella submarina]MCL1038040.1 hypothetical protein [Shewanella submarina]